MSYETIARYSNGNGTIQICEPNNSAEDNEGDGEAFDGDIMNEPGSNYEEEEKKCSRGDLGVDDSWLRLNYSNFAPIHELVDSSLELISFC